MSLQLALRVAGLQASCRSTRRCSASSLAQALPGDANFALAEPPLKLALMNDGSE